MIGETLNQRYKITTRLGKGAMGTVYRATDMQSGQDIALKIMASDLALNDEMLERFKREGEALSKLKHHNIVGYIDAFEHNEQYVIVMEYVTGGSLHDQIKSNSLPVDRARQIALGLCDALIRSHQLGIVHRDIKPENVLIDEDGTPKLADFGVARLSEGTRMTRTGTKVGTPYYMSPEAWKGEKIDAQADIWSLGVMLFEMLSGQVPFDGDSEFTVMTKVCTTPPPDLKKLRKDVPNDLEKIVKRMLAKDKSERYKTMRQVAVDLENEEPHVPTKAKKPAPATRIVTPARSFTISKNMRVGGLAVIGVLLVIFGGNYFMQNIPTSQSPASTFQSPVSNLQSPTATRRPTNTPPPPTIAFTPTPGIGSTLVSEKDGMTLVFVPAGEFIMGSDDSNQSDERPEHQVNVDAFWIDQTEVTNAMYAQCVNSNQCNPPASTNTFNNSEYANHPVLYVSWNDAVAYCDYVDRRLPTEAEWEKAARGTDGSIYPWGNTDRKDNLLNFNGNVGDTTEVGSYPAGASIYGALDMSGNVWEWVSSLYQPYPYDANDGRESLTSSDARVLRGGSWNDYYNFVRSALRNGSNPSNSYYHFGFRCSRSP